MDTGIPIATVAGALGSLLTWGLARTGLSSSQKRWVALSATLLLVLVGMFAWYQPDAWEQVAAVIAAAFGVMQVVYTGLKPFYDSLDIKFPPISRGESERDETTRR